jgi:hypothetical protein
MKHRLVLLCEPHLLGDTLENILLNLEEVDFLGSWSIDNQVMARLSEQTPDILLIGEEEKHREQLTQLTARILEKFPNLSIIRVSLANNTLQVYTSQVLPARTANLVEVIRNMPAQHMIEKKD